MYGGLSGGDYFGNYWVYVTNYGAGISWKLTAIDGNGNVLLEEEGEFDDDGCDDQTSSVFTFNFGDYVDNDCDAADMAAVSAVERESPKYESRKA